MRIVHIAAGAGQMYCGACNRDIELVIGLIARGHDVEVVPFYTPLRFETGKGFRTSPIFFGGINVYLQQVSAVFRHTPALLDRVFDIPALINWATKFSVEIRPEKLGPMTVSMLSGKHGRQSKELKRLLRYIANDNRLDLISITNSMLSGIAPELKSRLDVPVVCSLQGEDAFIESIPEPFCSEAKGLMQRNAAAVDLFVAPSQSYADKMSEFLSVSREKISVVRAGIDPDSYSHTGPRQQGTFVIGHLSSISPTKGLDILVDAFIRLVKIEKRNVQLRVAGKVLDKAFWESITRKIASSGLESRFEYLGEVDFHSKVEFLRGCSVFSLPSRIAESRGMVVMEAMAAGVPVVVPYSGVFPEMITLTAGGILVPPGDKNALADAIARIMDDPDTADAMGRSGAEGIRTHYSSDQMADGMLKEYSGLIRKRGQR